MKKIFKRQLALGLVILFLISIGSPQNTFAKGTDSKGATEKAIVTEKVKIEYGPYDNEVKVKKYSYEPFDEKENKNSIASKDLNYIKDRVLVKMEEPNTIFGIFKAKAPSLKNGNVTKLELVDKVKKDNKKEKSSISSSNNGAKWYSASLKEGVDIA